MEEIYDHRNPNRNNHVDLLHDLRICSGKLLFQEIPLPHEWQVDSHQYPCLWFAKSIHAIFRCSCLSHSQKNSPTATRGKGKH